MGYDFEASGTPQGNFNSGVSYYQMGEYDKALRYFTAAYNAGEDDNFTKDCENFIDKCEAKIKEYAENEQEALTLYNDGKIAYNIACQIQQYDAFQNAKFKFERAYDLTSNEQLQEDCEDYIKNCTEWMDDYRLS